MRSISCAGPPSCTRSAFPSPHNGYHKHGAYILTFADMPGFSKKDQARLAMLVLGHRGKLDKVAVLPKGDVNWLLILSLRLAVLFHRSRSDQGRPPYSIAMGDKGATLELPGGLAGRQSPDGGGLRRRNPGLAAGRPENSA